MSKESTALVMVGPSGVGPFHVPAWQVGTTLQLVEGGTRGPFWLAAPAAHDDSATGSTGPTVLIIDSLDPDMVARSLVLLIAATLANDELLHTLTQSSNVIVRDARRLIAEPWHLDDALLTRCVDWLAARCRIGVVVLDDSSLLGSSQLKPHSIELLRQWGLSVEVFRSTQ